MKRDKRIELMRAEDVGFDRWLWKLAPEHHGKPKGMCYELFYEEMAEARPEPEPPVMSARFTSEEDEDGWENPDREADY